MRGKLLLAGICMMLCGIGMPSVSVSADEPEEKVIQLTEEEMQEVMEQMIEDLFTTFSSKHSIDWKIPKKTRAGSDDYFHKDKGQAVIIDVDLSKSAQVGILGMNGVFQYLEGTSIFHAYEALTSQDYCVSVYNPNSSSIEVTGYYIR